MFHVVVEIEHGNPLPIPNHIIGDLVTTVPDFLHEEIEPLLPEMDTPNKTVAEWKGNDSSTILFYTGNPTVESIKGIFHLCKDADSKIVNIANGDTDSTELWDTNIPKMRSNLLCILSVPRWMSTSEFCQWMSTHEGIIQMRVIKSPNPALYMVILQFLSQNYADHFYVSTNSHQFNTMEPDRCYSVFIQDVEFIEPRDGILFDNKNLKELPSCPVCLERLDAEETGVITSVCNHQFHSNCLSQCESESKCPVCRYSLQCNTASNICCECDAKDSLWLCLLCGNIGCSRYRGEHAILHFQNSGHPYALEIDTQRVWDYAGDGYVHRLIQSNADGKLVEISEPTGGTQSKPKGKDQSAIDSLAVEYNYLLASQLESQRTYFEQREAKKQAEIHSLEEKLQFYIQQADSAEEKEKKVAELAKKNSQMTSRLGNLQAEGKALKKEIAILREMNDNLEQNQEKWKETIATIENKSLEQLTSKEDRLTDLEGQVRDLMLHLESSAKLASVSASDIEDGTVLGIGGPKPKPKLRRSKKKNR